jgi:mannose-6-phosphate isomerase
MVREIWGSLMTPYALKFEPIYKPKLWGGTRIFEYFQRAPIGSEPIGESWELADLEEDASRVVNGPARGKTLTRLTAEWGRELVGDADLFEGRFPLLIKYLDARENLSVQVHPTEQVARELGGNVRVKHEAWYVLDCDRGGVIYHGLQPGVSKEAFIEAMSTGRIEGILRKVRVQPGDCYYLPTGTVHALGAGVLVAEVQTPSDITYRTYDWGRIDPKTGKPRQLHLEQAVKCIDFDRSSPVPMQERLHLGTIAATATRLVTCPSFVMDKLRMSGGAEHAMATGGLIVLMSLEGLGRIDSGEEGEPIEVRPGDVVLLPAALSGARARAITPVRWLEVAVPATQE